MKTKPVLIIIPLLLSLIFFVTIFSINKTPELTFVTNSENIEHFTESFNSSQNDFVVRVQVIGDYESTMKIRFNTDNFGDIFIVPLSISKSTYIDILEPLGSSDELEGLYPLTTTNTIDSTVYAIPTGFYIGGGVFYDEEVLKSSGIDTLPRSPEELYIVLKTLGKDSTITPFISNYSEKWLLNNWYDIILAAPGNLNRTDLLNGNPFDNISLYKRTFELLYNLANEQLIEEDIYTWTMKDTMKLFSKGKLGATSLPIHYYSEILQHAKHPDAIRYIPFNRNDNLILNSVYSVGINKHSKYKKESRIFLDYLLNETSYMDEMKQLQGLEELLQSEGYTLITPPAYRFEQLSALENLIWESESGLFSHFKLMEYIDSGYSGHTSFEKMILKQREMWRKTQL